VTLPSLLPPRDLLDQLEGVERGLRHGRRARLFGVLLGAVQITILLVNSPWLADLRAGDWEQLSEQWPLFISLFLLVLSVLLVSWARFWLRESKAPFRYTYAITPFEPVAGDEEQPLLVAMHADLRERLSTRIRRLSLLEEYQESPDEDGRREGAEEARAESHLHLSGYYAVRNRPPDKRWFVEVTPWVRVGGVGKPAKLAVPVKFALPRDRKIGKSGLPSIERDDYEQIVERTYFCIATEVYGQIKEDVQRKIELLPNRWFRASALFHEARDYARSNTLDAYDHARDLYAATLSIYDPGSAPLPEAALRRHLARIRRRFLLMLGWARRWASRVIARVGRPEVLAARAQVGYVNAMLDTAVLAPLSGLRAGAVFEAAPTARKARRRLEQLAPDVPGRRAALFDANVALAFASSSLNDRREGRRALGRAGADEPARADRDPRFLFVRAELEDRLLSRIPLFQRAVELAPRFEVAQFELASASEQLWRTRPSLERTVAETVFEQYGDVLKLNPGNIAAWANYGYLWWLLDEHDEAKAKFEAGLRVKEIKREAYVAEIDHGLARLAAEAGDFAAAYDHYIQAVSSRVSKGWAVGSYEGYHFEQIGDAMLNRYRRYVAETAKHHERLGKDDDEPTTQRVRDSVYAFVLYDHSQACWHYFQRTRDYTVLEEGYQACSQAVDLNERFVLATFQLYNLERQRAEFVPCDEPAGRYLDRVETLQPGWPEAALSLLQWYDEQAARARAEADAAAQEEKALSEEADQLQETLTDSRNATGFEEQPVGAVAGIGGGEEPAGHSRIGELRQRAQDAQARAEAARKDVAAFEAKARSLPRKLLPHRWLWSKDREFNWDAIYDRVAERELRWERSFEDFHVSALFALCRFHSNQPTVDRRLDEKLDDLLDLLEERFWPNMIELHTLRRVRAGFAADQRRRRRWARRKRRRRTGDDYRALIADMVDGWLENDEPPYGALSWLDLDGPEACQRYVEVANRKDLSPYLHHWIGQRLLERWRSSAQYGGADDDAREGALVAFENAMSIEQPQAVLELADALQELGQAKESEGLYDRVAESSATPALLIELAGRFANMRSFDRTLDLLEQARAQDAGSARPFKRPEYYSVETACALFALERADDAIAKLGEVPPDDGAMGAWRVALTQRLIGMGALPTREMHVRFRDWLGAVAHDAIRAPEPKTAEDAGLAALQLSHEAWADTAWRPLTPKQEAQARSPVPLPIGVEAHSRLFPQEAETPVVARMIQEDIPSIQQEIEGRTGVPVPGFRLASNPNLPEAGYRIYINQVVVEEGLVPDDAEDPHHHLLDRAAEAIRVRLAGFLDMQSVGTMVDGWTRDHPDEEGRIEDALGTERRRRGFVHLVKLAVADGIPVDDLGPLLGIYAEDTSETPDLAGMVEGLRARLRDRLEGGDRLRVIVPEALEARIAELMRPNGSWPDVVVDDNELAMLRAEIRQLRPVDNPAVLVVSCPDVRPAVRRVATLDDPDIAVLTSDELPPPRAGGAGILPFRVRAQ
jgi:hypothetical protein